MVKKLVLDGNPDHIIELVNPSNPDTWKVIKGKKSVKQLIKENLEIPRDWEGRTGRLNDAQLNARQSELRTKFKINNIIIRRKPE